MLSLVNTTNLVSLRAAYLELVLAMQTRTSRKRQQSFVESLCDNYGSITMGRMQHVWDPVRGDFTHRSALTACHIFPLAMGQKSMTYIFGEEAEDEINRARNGLFLPPEVEPAFDKHEIVIVPDGVQTTPQDYRIIVLDKSGRWEYPAFPGGDPWKDLHGKKLRFQPGNNFRPRSRYLYFHYIVSMLIHYRNRNVKHGTHSVELPEANMPELSKLWATEGKYLRKNVMLAFIEGLGHELLPSEDVLGHADDDIPDNEGEAATKGIEELDLVSSDEDD